MKTLTRGMVSCMGRESLYTMAMLGLTPLLQVRAHTHTHTHTLPPPSHYPLSLSLSLSLFAAPLPPPPLAARSKRGTVPTGH
jgi:hypothetical protein